LSSTVSESVLTNLCCYLQICTWHWMIRSQTKPKNANAAGLPHRCYIHFSTLSRGAGSARTSASAVRKWSSLSVDPSSRLPARSLIHLAYDKSRMAESRDHQAVKELLMRWPRTCGKTDRKDCPADIRFRGFEDRFL